MRILWVKMGGLWPSTAGGRIRSLETLSCLSRRHDVTVVTTHGPADDPEGLRRRLPHCVRVVSIPFVAPRAGTLPFARALAGSWCTRYPVDLWKWRTRAVRDEVRSLMASGAVDLCVADFLVSLPNVPGPRRVPLVLFEHNVEHVIWQRVAGLERRPLHRAVLEIEAWKVRRAERRGCSAADLVIAVSADDRERLHGLAPRSRCVAIPTGVDTTYFQPAGAPEAHNRLVFTGSMDWYPNEDAMLYFAEAILPRIRAEVPDVTLSVVGRNPSPRLREAAVRAGIVVTGTVDDVRPFIDEAALYIVPLRAGGGTRLKIFEALAMGKAVVSTRVGAEGLSLTPGRDVAIADQPDAFAATVATLLRDPARRRALGRAGRQLVQRRYSWEQISSEFEHHCQAAARIRRETSGTSLALAREQSSS
ncbi:MAG TPA: glycosyltransferase family 4 protein [Vicinamibacterales bacterium]|jgi:glycosyltransferase involved in cell wall biosynthesis|nr:glycosyltransferase family 4 protein [Vicinamibacterales bacterium]